MVWSDTERRAARMEARFRWPTIGAAVLVVPTIVLEQSQTGALGATVRVLNWAIWLVFAAELVAMLVVVPRRRAYLRAHVLDVAIVLFTPPFLPASLQAARVFRLVRLLRLAKTFGVVRAVLSPEGVRDAAIVATFVVLGGGAAFAAVERGTHPGMTTWDGVWWAMTTVTTVGYGDITPHTTGGRLIGMVVMLVGIGFVALVTAAAADRFLRQPRSSAGDGLGLADLELEVLRLRERIAALEAGVVATPSAQPDA